MFFSLRKAFAAAEAVVLLGGPCGKKRPLAHTIRASTHVKGLKKEGFASYSPPFCIEKYWCSCYDKGVRTYPIYSSDK